MIKFYEVAPEHRESPIDDLDFETGEQFENVSVTGNHDYRDHKSEAFRQAEKIAEYIRDDYDDGFIKSHFSFKRTSDLESVITCMREYRYRDEYVITRLLSAITGEDYGTREIHGSCQGEWNRIYFPEYMGGDFVDWFETAYFNNGSEWVVEDDDSRISLYSCEWDPEKIKIDLADQLGVEVSECEFYKFDGYKKEPKYKSI